MVTKKQQDNWNAWYRENKDYYNKKKRLKAFDNGFVKFPRGRRMLEINPNKFSVWLAEQRKNRGVSVEWCAKMTGIKPSAWKFYECGISVPCERNYIKITKIFGEYNEQD